MFDIKRFDSYREDNRLEVKKSSGGLPLSLWETYSSFANSYGGLIILGVAEDKDGSWHTTGLKDGRRLQKEFWDTINNPTKVSLNVLSDNDVEIITEPDSGDVIMVIHVPPAKRSDRPIFLNADMMRCTFRRNWEGDYRCSKSEVKAMLRDQPENTMDMKVIEDFTIDQLNKDSIKGYRNRHRVLRPGHPWEELGDEKYLEKIGAAAIGGDGKMHPTAAGLLMFGDEYLIVREFPDYFLDYREILDPAIRWTDRFYSSTGEWSGNVYDFYFRVYNRLIQDVKVPFKMVGGDRIDDTPVHKALREALANCLVNTDFYVPRGVVIKKEREKITFENPGYVRVGKYQMQKGGESDPRNRTLMKMFNMIDIGERAGSGVPELFSVCKQQGWDNPKIEERFGDAARTFLTLPLSNTTRKTTQKTTQKTIERILNLIKENPYITSTEIANKLEITRDGVNYNIRKLKQTGMLKREGPDKGGYWQILDDD